MKTPLRCFPFALLAMGLVVPAFAASAATYRLIQEIPVGGVGGWDYLSIDPAAHRLYVSHASVVVVIDTVTNTVVGKIEDTPGVHGLAVAPDLRKGFTTNGSENKSSVVDLTTLKTLTKVETGQGPDGMLYDPGQHEVYTFNGRGNSATVIDARTNAVIATIPLGGRPESGAADPKVGRVFDNIESTSEVVAIDTKSHKVANRWPIAPGEGASGMAIDPDHQRLFLGAGGTNTMVMFDYANGKVVASVPIGAGVDANAFDPGLQLAFASSSDGTVTIAHEDSPSKLTVVQTLKTEARARTLTLDPTTHRIYLGSAQFVGGGGRGGTTVPGSFKILVYGVE
jgi:YVTN family beta-propeller protein